MEELDINPRIISALRKAQLRDYGTVLSLSAQELQRLTQLSLSDIKQLHQAIAITSKSLPTQKTTALELHKGTCPVELRRKILTTGCPTIDSFLRGGLLSQTLTEIAGESASGKTQLCLQLCLTVQLPTELGGLNGGAVYICTEDVFPDKRLQQMVTRLRQRSDGPVKNIKFTDNIFIEHAAELDDLLHCLTKKLPVLLSQGRVKLIVIDSIAALFRCDHDSRSLFNRAKLMRNIATQLLHLSVEHNIPAICVNQVSDLIRDNNTSAHPGRKVIPSLGISWANLVTVRLMLARTTLTISTPQRNLRGDVMGCVDTPIRTMEVLFAPHLSNTLCRYIVDQDGVKGLPA